MMMICICNLWVMTRCLSLSRERERVWSSQEFCVRTPERIYMYADLNATSDVV